MGVETDSATAETKNTRTFGLSGFVLKIIACAAMTIDHIGAEFFPELSVFRIIGRLAFPLFAYFIAEGCRYTGHPIKRLVTMAALGLVCVLAFFVFSGEYYGNILITFSFSVALIFLMRECKKCVFGAEKNVPCAVLWAAAFVCGGIGAYFFSRYVGVDYGFAGIMAPVIVCLFDFRGLTVPAFLRELDNFAGRMVCFSVALILVVLQVGVATVQPFSLAAVPLMLLYNGRPGKFKFKYGFYVYYPLHLLIIGIISLLL